jgi:ribonuclease BN (tRNA processing enzyme)
LISDGETSCLFDLGSGAFANMREHLDYDIIDHIVISHMHADHFFDLIPLRYALLYGPRKRETKVEVWLPPDGEAMLRSQVNSFADEGAGDFLNTVFDIKTYDPSTQITFGRANISFAPSRHYIPTFSLRYANNGTVITYSADTAPNDSVIKHARDSTLFICEATLLPEEVEHGMRGHSSAIEAGEMARAANVERLMLTHYPSEASQEELILHARAIYHGQIVVADDHARLSL